MKNSHLIISQLKNTLPWSKLKETQEIKKLIHSLTLEMRKYISFAHKKEKILFVALKNPNLCAEFNTYTAPILLGIIGSLKEEFPLLKSIQEIKAYFPQTTRSKQSQKQTITKDHLQKLLKQAKTYRQRREIIQKFQSQGAIHFLPPKHFASYNEIIETYFLQAYKEKSDGEFEILSKCPKISQIFSSIQLAIKNSHEF